MPRSNGGLSDFGSFLDDDVLKQETEETGVDPVGGKGRGGKKELQRRGNGESDIGDGVAKEGVEPWDERGEIEGGRHEGNALGVFNKGTCTRKGMKAEFEGKERM